MSVILITGGAKRIGREIAISLGRQHKIIIHYHNSKTEAQKTADTIIQNGGDADIIQQNLFDDNAAEYLFYNALKIYHTIDVIINSASIFIPDTINQLSTQLWQQHQAIHVTVPMLLTHLLLKHTNINHTQSNITKNIINILDQRVYRPTPEFFSYTASKMFLHALTKQCAIACSPKVRVNALAPGSVLPSPRQTQEDFNKQANMTPLQRAVTLNEITNAINFILNSLSLTGEIITLDAGQNIDWRTVNFLENHE